MKNKSFRIYFIIYFLALIVVGTAQTLLKLYSTNPISGFTELGSAPYDIVFLYLVRILLVGAIVFWFFITTKRRSQHDFPVTYQNTLAGILAMATGLSMIVYTVTALPEQVVTPPALILDDNQRTMNKILIIIVITLGVIAGVSMILSGFRPKYGVWGKPGAMLGFFPALWQLVILLTRFNRFVPATTITDTLLVVLFMCFSSMFLIGQSRIIFGLGVRTGKTYAIPSGLSVSLIGLVFVISNLSYFVNKGFFNFNVNIAMPEFVYMTLLSLYAVVFICGYLKSIKHV